MLPITYKVFSYKKFCLNTFVIYIYNIQFTVLNSIIIWLFLIEIIFHYFIFTVRVEFHCDVYIVTRAFSHASFLRSNGVCRPVPDPEAEHEGSADLRRPLRAL